MRAQAEIRGSFRGVQQLLHSPRLPRTGIPFHCIRREAIERNVIRGMHGDKLALQMRRQFGQMQTVPR